MVTITRGRPTRLRRLAQASGSALLAMLVLELFFRVMAPQDDLAYVAGMYMPDEVLGYRLMPSFFGTVRSFTVKISSQGMRDREHASRPAAGTRRLLVLGDSFAFGFGVEADSTFPARMQHHLDHDLGAARWEVINTGVGGWGTDQETSYFERDGAAWQPDLVLLQFFIGNDITDNESQDELTVVDGTLVRREDMRQSGQGLRRLLFRSHLVRFVAARLRMVLWARMEERAMRARQSGTESTRELSESQVDRFFRVQSGMLAVFSRAKQPAIELGWQRTESYLERLRAATTRTGTRMVVVSIPAAFQANAARRAELLGSIHAQELDFDFDAPSARLREICARVGIEVIDLLPALRDVEGTPSPMFLDRDHHFSASGHELAARTICARLRALGWLE